MSFEQLREQYGSLMRAKIRSYLKNQADVEDCCQMAEYKLWQAAQNGYIDSEQSPKAYVAALARNAALDYLRDDAARRQHEVMSLDEPAPGQDTQTYDGPLFAAETVLVSTPLTDAVAKAVEQLSPTLRHVIDLRFYRELDFADIAGLLQISEGAVRVRLTRAIAALKSSQQCNKAAA